MMAKLQKRQFSFAEWLNGNQHSAQKNVSKSKTFFGEGLTILHEGRTLGEGMGVEHW